MNFNKISRFNPQRDDSQHDLFCGPAVLFRFGIVNVKNGPMKKFEIKQSFVEAGYSLSRVDLLNEFNIMRKISERLDQGKSAYAAYPTLNDFMKRFYSDGDLSKYDIAIITNGHILCIKDGILTDTDEKAGGRRRVQEAFFVEQ